jgi:hypothetical protein
MATEVGKLYYDLSIDDGKLQSGLSSADSKLQGFGSKLDSFGDKAMNIGKKMSIGVTLPIVALATYGAKAFSDLNEAGNAVTVVFGDASDKLTEFAKNASTQVGLSKRAFLEAATPMGAALQNVGYSADDAAAKSIELTKRAADMASVFNTDVSEALTAINSGLRGETEPIKRFGISLDDASVKAYAVSKGIIKAGDEMTQSQKVQVRYALLMEQSSKVQGDFINTSDGIANSQRILKAQTEDTAAKFGQNLAPAVQKLQAEGLKLLERFNALTPAQQEMAIKGLALLAVVGPLTTAIGGLAKAALFAWSSLGPVAAFIAVGGVSAMINFKNSTDLATSSINKNQQAMQQLGFDATALKAGFDPLKVSQDFLRQSTDMVKDAQNQAADSANKLKDANYNLEGANLRAESAQKIYTDAVKRFGPDSYEARQAQHDLNGALQDQKTAADNAKKANEEKAKKDEELAKKKDLENSARDANEKLKEQEGLLDRIGSKVKNLGKAAGNKATDAGGGLLRMLPGFATGVRNFGGGLAMVGERGPELVNLPKGSDVIPNDRLDTALRDTPDMGGQNVTVNLHLEGVYANSRSAVREMGMDIIAAVNEGLRAQGKQEIGV